MWKMWYHQHVMTVAQRKVWVHNGSQIYDLPNTRHVWFIDYHIFHMTLNSLECVMKMNLKKTIYLLQMLFPSQLLAMKVMIHSTMAKSYLEQEQVQRVNMTIKKCAARLSRQFLLQLLFTNSRGRLCNSFYDLKTFLPFQLLFHLS